MTRRKALESLDADIREHLERETLDNIERGMDPVEARRAALRKFGNPARVMEDTREVWRWVWLEQLLQDLRYAFRCLRRDPRFAAVVVLTMALGIGINTAVFSVVNTVLLKPLAYPNPGRLVWLGSYDPNIRRDFVWKPDYHEWRKRAQSYSAMAAFGYQQAAIVAPRGATQTTAVYVIGDFWKITGARPALGRLFTDEDHDSLVLSWDYFEREFSANPAVVGQSVVINARPFRIAGVLPPTFVFQFPMWWAAAHPEPVEAYLSELRPGEGVAQSTQVVAALKPGVTTGQALAELQALERGLVEARGEQTNGMNRIHVDALGEQLTGSSRQALLVLLAAGAFVLLIATVNVANLLLARGSQRQREIAVRAAVGAGRSRVIRQLLVESLLQALAGGVAGLLLAWWAIAVLVRVQPHAIPRLAETAIDGRVLAFTLAVSVLTGILFGAGPALATRGINLHDSLKSGARNSGGRSGLRLRRMLVAVELALAIVLVTGAGLMLKSFARMNAHAPGFDPANVIVMKVRFAGPQYLKPAVAQAYWHEVMRRLEATTGLESAGISCWYLFGGAPAFPADTDRSATHVVRINEVTPGYLKTLGMTLRRGRWLTETDTDAVLLNESMARQAFGAKDPIGHQLSIPRPVTVVGIVSDVKYSKLDAAAPPELYREFGHVQDLWMVEIAARAARHPAAVESALRKSISEIDPSQPLYDVKTLEEALAQSIAPRRFNLFLLGGFAAAALLLAVVGIYGVAAYSVAARTREIGVRMALGARRGSAAAGVLWEAAPLVLAGLAAGLAATRGLSRIMESLLYEVKAEDPETFALVGVLLAIAALAAVAGPAVRAASIEPAIALRYE